MKMILILSAMSLIVLMQNCSDLNLKMKQQVEVQSKVEGGFCLAPPSVKETYNNILFVIDRSGSNTDGSGTGRPGSDPDLKVRGSAMDQFLSDHEDDPFYRWGFIYFSGQEVSSYINEGNDQVPTFNSSGVMRGALNTFYSNPDVSGSFGTDYTRSLALVENAITNDLTQNKGKTDEEHVYTVFFVSDGYPIESSRAYPIVDDDDPRLRKIREITALPARFISLSTIFYSSLNSQADPSVAIKGLEKMAEAGGGIFSNYLDTGVINFEDIRVGSRPEAWRIKRMRLVVFNLNSAACVDGEVGTDSDSDGICDRDEELYNNDESLKASMGGNRFDPQNRNSLNEDFSDAFVWKFSLLPSGSGLGACSKNTVDSDFDFLNTCEEQMLHDENANGPHADWIIPKNSADPTNPDSDGDAFLDWVEFSWFRMDSSFSAPINYTNIFDQYAPGVSAEVLMAEHRSFIKPDNFEQSSYDTKLRFTGINQKGENCYSFNQTQLALYPTLEVTDSSKVSGIEDLTHEAGENKVLMYFIATPEQSPNSRGVLFHSIRSLHYNDAQLGADPGLNISPDLSDFEFYRIPDL